MSHKVEGFRGDEPEERPPTEDELRERAKAKAMLEDIAKIHARAKYKLEVMFGHNRSLNQPTPGILSFWESGLKLNTDMDTSAYICPGSKLGKNNCSRPIPSAFNSSVTVCPACEQLWDNEQLIGQVIACSTMKNWGVLVYDYFRRFDSNCDIIMKHSGGQLKKATELEMERDRGGERLNKVRVKMERAIYPLSRIIKDVSAGADVLLRIQEFLRS